MYSNAVVKLCNNVMPRKFHVWPLGSPLVCFQACVVSIQWLCYCTCLLLCFFLCVSSICILPVLLLLRTARFNGQWPGLIVCHVFMYRWRLCCLSVIHSVCEQDYCKSNQLISLKLGVMIGPTNQKNWLTFGGDLLPDTDSRSLLLASLLQNGGF